ncbi:MAG: glycosyltransferase family 4 protein [Caldimicrobium sp.]
MRKKIGFLLDNFGNRRHFIQLKTLKEAGFDPKIITFLKAKEGYLFAKREAKAFVIQLPYERSKIMKKFSLKCALALLKLLKKENIQIVLTHRYKLLRYLWFCKFFYPELKIIFHIVNNEDIKGWHQCYFLKRCKKLINKILVNSLALKEELVRKKLAKEEEIEVFYSGVDTKEFEVEMDKAEARKRFSLPQEEFLFGMVARFRKEKDHIGVIKAFKMLKEKGYQAKLVFAGDGPTLDACRNLTQKLGLERDIIYMGYLIPTDVPYLLRALDAYLYATYREGMPLAVLEAMAASLPIIATNTGGLFDIFQSDKKFGFLLPKGNIEMLAEAMEKIINLSEEERKLWGYEAKERILEEFSFEKLKERTLKLFQEL